MNLVGKSLIFLIFVMSIFFMAASVLVFSTHEDLQAKHDSLQQRYNGLQTEINTLTNERSQLERQLAMERAARTQALASMESQLQTQNQQLATGQQELEQTRADARALTAAVQASAESVAGLQKQVDVQRSEIVSLLEDQRDKFERVLVVTDENNQLNGMLQRVEAQSRDLRNALGVAEQVLEYHGLEPTAPVTSVAPRAEGEVLEVRGNLVAVSLGSDDGLRVGHELDVSRGQRYLGRIRIVKTKPDVAVGEILEGFRRGAIQRQDRVRTQVR